MLLTDTILRIVTIAQQVDDIPDYVEMSMEIDFRGFNWIKLYMKPTKATKSFFLCRDHESYGNCR